MWEVVVVVVIVSIAGIWAIRGVVRAARKNRICSSCAQSGGCPLAHGGDKTPLGSECAPSDLKSRESVEG